MSQFTRLLLAAVLVFSASPAWADTFSFTTLQPDKRMAAATRIEDSNLIEIETGDDFVTTAEQTVLTSASFFGLLQNAAAVSSIQQVVVEIYRVFPLDSVSPPNGKVPTRNNSPSDVAFDTRDSDQQGELTFVPTGLGSFTANNSVLNGINAATPATGGDGQITGTEVRIDVTFTSPFRLPPGHYFFVPQVRLDGGNTFFWLSAVGNNPPAFQGDLQAWIRNANLDPNWLRIGTDIVDSSPAPTFNMAFSVTGTTEASSLVASVLPSSRSVQVGNTATAFATVINPTGSTVRGVRVDLNTPNLPLKDFFSQPTDPSTNIPIGSRGDTVDLAPGQKQTFVIGLTPAAPIDPTDVSFSFHGGNAPVISGVDTLLFSASVAPVPDIVALAATINNDGIVNVPGANGTGVFAVATSNVGADATITASADTGNAQLPLTISLCQTNPATGQCLNPAAPTTSPVIAQIVNQGTATFGFFVTGQGNIPFAPATNRVLVRFKDAAGVVHGTTSVAVRTQ
jgi:hypothetical protein